jgi:phospho-N-acetylmuramoyl-pentapeptide-transferase
MILLPLGVIYIIETASVILQVIYFKCFKKRIFLMSPLHHHFEILGFSEKKILYLFWGIHGLGVLILFITPT